jgi:mannose-6-phosphate isomerase class I
LLYYQIQIISISILFSLSVKKVWRYQTYEGNQKRKIEEGETIKKKNENKKQTMVATENFRLTNTNSTGNQECKLTSSARVIIQCPTSTPVVVIILKTPVTNHERGIFTATHGTCLWSSVKQTFLYI